MPLNGISAPQNRKPLNPAKQRGPTRRYTLPLPLVNLHRRFNRHFSSKSRTKQCLRIRNDLLILVKSIPEASKTVLTVKEWATKNKIQVNLKKGKSAFLRLSKGPQDVVTNSIAFNSRSTLSIRIQILGIQLQQLSRL